MKSAGLTEHRSFHKIIARNSLTNLLRYVINYSIVLVLTPLIIRGIGDSLYGLWALISSLIGYAGLLDLGVQQATIKLVAEYNGKGDSESLSAVASTATMFFGSLGVFVCAVCWFILPGCMHYFVSDPQTLAVSKGLLFILGMDVIFVFLGNVFTGVALGLHQYHYKGIFDILCGFARLGLTFYLLSAGYGIIGLAWLALGLNIFSTAAMCWACRRGFSGIRLWPDQVSWKIFRQMLPFGGKVFTASTMSRINNSTNVAVISYLLTTVWTAYYNVAVRVVGYAQEIVWTLTASFLPVFSELSAQGNFDQSRELYIRYTRYILTVSMPLISMILLFGYDFISLWISKEYADNSRIALIILGTDALVAGLQPLVARYMIGGGNVGFYSKVVTGGGLGTLALSFPFTKIFGIAGPPLAMLSATVVMQGIFFGRFCKNMKFSPMWFLNACHVRVFPAVLALTTVMYAARESFLSGQIQVAVACTFVAIGSYFTLLWAITLNKSERDAILVKAQSLLANNR